MHQHRVPAPIWDITEADWEDHRPNSRFAIHRGSAAQPDAVFDKETGLVWERSPDVGRRENWDAAVVYSYAKAVGGRRGWRLPTIEELLTLIDPAQSGPMLPERHPFRDVQFDDFYWSSTLGMSSPPTYAWGCHFGNGDVSNCLKSAQFYAWLVRGGSGHDYPY